ncbi:uncharacterized protein LOC131679191 isoform X2 [Topomyia yanbarensis]|uniref:uncharacterized protein LOC131679191 isoform X2 n=1 Tax=Topomyia yanbarensis TaxID=2498891 RepID=UPI00273CB285|nr:uncharacterized protein LOC131679191 isoform X2 [Topomyia yanbarensis]
MRILHLFIDHLLEAPENDSTKQKLSALLNISSVGDELTFTLKQVDTLLRQYCLNEINETELKSHFTQLSPATQRTLVDVIEQRKPEIAQFLINEINAKDNVLMESFDWDVKWIMGNSSLASIRQQIVTVAINCRGKDLKLKTVRFEMNRERLEEFIRLLEQSDQIK